MLIGGILVPTSESVSSGTTGIDGRSAVGTLGNELGAAGNFIAVDLDPALPKVPPPTDGFLGPIPDIIEGPLRIVGNGFFRSPESTSETSNAGKLSILLCFFIGLTEKEAA